MRLHGTRSYGLLGVNEFFLYAEALRSFVPCGPILRLNTGTHEEEAAALPVELFLAGDPNSTCDKVAHPRTWTILQPTPITHKNHD